MTIKKPRPPKYEYFRCDCGCDYHNFVISYWPGDTDELEYRNIYISYHLVTWEGFFRRLWTGIKYAFGFKSKYGDYDEILLNIYETDRLIESLQQARAEVFGPRVKEIYHE